MLKPESILENEMGKIFWGHHSLGSFMGSLDPGQKSKPSVNQPKKKELVL